MRGAEEDERTFGSVDFSDYDRLIFDLEELITREPEGFPDLNDLGLKVASSVINETWNF